MKTIQFKILKSMGVTLCLILVSWLMLKLLGELTNDAMKIIASIYSMYVFPIILGNLLLLSNDKANLTNKTALVSQILKSVLLSMLILFGMNFILWIIVWRAPLGDLFTERNLIFYLIGFCNLLVMSIVFHSIVYRMSLNWLNQ